MTFQERQCEQKRTRGEFFFFYVLQKYVPTSARLCVFSCLSIDHAVSLISLSVPNVPHRSGRVVNSKDLSRVPRGPQSADPNATGRGKSFHLTDLESGISCH